MVYAGFEAGSMRVLKHKSCRGKIVYLWIETVRNIFYAGIEAGKKDCLWKGLRIV